MDHRYRSMASIASTLELSAPYRRRALFQEKDLFIAGLDDVNIYRIPAMLATASGTVLAFCEARERDDNDPTDLVLRRSLPVNKNLQGVNGVCWPNDRRWSPTKVVVPGNGEAILCPCPLIDRTDGKIWMCCRRVEGGLANSLDVAHGALLMLWSADEGATWSTPVEIDDQVGYFIPGPGVGTQTRSDRLIVPGYDRHSAKVIYSDDHGRTWQVGQTIGRQGGADESQAVELADGTLALNVRIAPGCRWVALSRDGGETWFEEHRAEALADPGCMAAIVRYSDEVTGDRNRLLFANPASPTDRAQLTVKLSYDEGLTWPVARIIHNGPAAYSSLAVLSDGTIGLLYETGDLHPYERIRFARFSLEWLTEGRDQLRPDLLPLELPLEWDFRLDPDDIGLEQGWFAEDATGTWEKIRIDSPWTSQGHDCHGVAWYRLRLAVPDQLWPDARLDVLFGAIHGYARAYVDGVQVAEEKVSPWVMSDRPFFAPLPGSVLPGQTCNLVVRVTKNDGQAGLWKPACLVERA